jgi:superfamily I DNA/RNA helicase
MTFDFFEGPAGTGKTYNLVSLAGELVRDGMLADGRKLLALTFMNGARRRLEARLGASPLFRRRFECQTFDVFARRLAARRKSLLSAALVDQTATLNAFDGPCFLAASLLEVQTVRQWVARGCPLIVVDEAQDLDEHRLRILQGLSESCAILAAADAFQCLADGRDTAPLISWLESAGQTHRLTQPRRTSQPGLLGAALAVREGRPIKSVLNQSQQARTPTWSRHGFRLLETHAANAGLVAWTIANEMSRQNGQTAILTPDAHNTLLRAALDAVSARQWTRSNGQTFGPYPHTWDRPDLEEADALLAGITLSEHASYGDLCAMLDPVAAHAPVAQAIGRMDRLRRVQGLVRFTSTQVIEFVREAVRNQSRLGLRQHRGDLAMTIQRAKNREFANVIVLWPYSVTGSPEHLRRLLYNAITRAMNHCSVIVLGQGRLNAPPFASRATD